MEYRLANQALTLAFSIQILIIAVGGGTGVSLNALFSAFGLLNTIIFILSFDYGMKDKERINDCIKYGILDTAVITFFITCIFELFANQISSLFGLSGGVRNKLLKHVL